VSDGRIPETVVPKLPERPRVRRDFVKINYWSTVGVVDSS